MDEEELSNAVEYGLRLIADKLAPVDAIDGKDACGGNVGSLTEAVMGVTAGLVAIAHAMESVQDAISNLPENGND